MKLKTILPVLVLSIAVLTGCNQANVPPTASPTPAASPDTVTTASIVNTEADFEKAISKNGTWIIATLKDLTFSTGLLLDGDFKNGKKDDAGKELYQRKIALYTQDANRRVTNRFTLTAPKIIINSLNGSIEHGTFKGDVYVAAKNFKLVDATVDGNVYFTTDDAKNTFTMDATSKVTGTQELKK